MPDPMRAWSKASSIGSALDESGVRRPGRDLPTPAQESNPIRTFMSLFTDPLGLEQPQEPMKPAGIGGLPEGLNAQALLEMIKREEEWSKLGPAIKQGAKTLAPSIMRAVAK